LPNRSSNTPSSKVCQTPLRASVYMVKNVGLFQTCSPTLLTLHIDVSDVERTDPLTIWLHRPPPCRRMPWVYSSFKKPFNLPDADYNSDTEELEEQELDLSVPGVMTKYKAVA
jgi:hypothetical protein